VERMNDHDAPVDERFTAAYWDDRYGTAERIWSGAPNAQLVAEVTDLPPGMALDAGCGEGGDAHWLAGRGWRVTALDVSEVALRRAAAHAPADAADRIRWQQADFTTWEPDGAVFDLVSAQFLHFPSALRKRVYAGLAAAVAPGGTLLIVAHEPSELHTGSVGSSGAHDHEPDMFVTAEQLAAELDPAAWEVLVTDSRPRVAQVDDREVPISDAVLRARRR
jgi:SAM-dependent methyltransferase